MFIFRASVEEGILSYPPPHIVYFATFSVFEDSNAAAAMLEGLKNGEQETI
jgi:hypothetical protein